MSGDMIRSGIGAPGIRSPRTYTRAEIAAARRRNLIVGKESTDSLNGALFWATGDYVPAKVRQARADYALLAAAIEREWPRPWGDDDE